MISLITRGGVGEKGWRGGVKGHWPVGRGPVEVVCGNVCVMSVKIALLAASGHGGVCKRSGQTGRGGSIKNRGAEAPRGSNPRREEANRQMARERRGA